MLGINVKYDVYKSTITFKKLFLQEIDLTNSYSSASKILRHLRLDHFLCELQEKMKFLSI